MIQSVMRENPHQKIQRREEKKNHNKATWAIQEVTLGSNPELGKEQQLELPLNASIPFYRLGKSYLLSINILRLSFYKSRKRSSRVYKRPLLIKWQTGRNKAKLMLAA